MAATSQKKETFEDYEGFVEKFKPKKTTDDCYTPPEVYSCIIEYINKNILDLSGYKVVRPFYPGGDYEKDAESYDEKTVVIDNPPFSILAKIKKFYVDRNIKFFLFAPHLTLFSGLRDNVQYVLSNADIAYDNGAVVATSFVTNLMDDSRYIVTASKLRLQIEEMQKKEKAKVAVKRLKYKYPSEVFLSCSVDTALRQGIDIAPIKRTECYFVRELDSQKEQKKAMYGGGYLVSTDVGLRAEEARKRAEEARKRAEEARKRAEEESKIVWELSPAEKEIISKLK